MEKTLTEEIRENWERVQQEIFTAAHAVGREPGEVRLLVVTKAQPVEKIRAAYQAGVRLFGENYPEETQVKIEAAGDLPGAEWHMIGHLQSRKIKIVAGSFSMLHSLDRLSLAEKLERALAEIDRVLPVLLEVNVSGEESKNGWPAWEESLWPGLRTDVERLLQFPHLQIEGLMTMPPLFDDPEGVRPFFRKTRILRDALAKTFPQASWRHLSMGTSGDFPAAVQEGATFVRVGTAIMGARPPRN